MNRAELVGSTAGLWPCLRAGLWKEWRDHRAIVVAYGIAVPLLLAIAAFVLPESPWIASRAAPPIGAVAGLAIAALAFGADLVPGEVRRGTLRFLARLPGDLRVAFAAKVVFLAFALAAFAAWSGLAVALAAAARHGVALAAMEWTRNGAAGWIVAILVGACWLLAVSCWLPRGTLVLPATLLVLAAGLAPVFAAFLANPGMEPQLLEPEGNAGMAAHATALCGLVTWLAASGLAVAALSFLRGGRFGGTPRSRLAWSAGPALVAFLPLWGWAGLRVREHRHLDTREATFRLHATALGAGGRYAFVAGFHELEPTRSAQQSAVLGASHPLIVDTLDGTFREVGEPGDLFWYLGPRSERSRAAAVLLVAEKLDARVPTASQFSDGFDGASGRPLDAAQWKELLRGRRGDDSVGGDDAGFALLPDGRRLVLAGGTARVESDDGTRVTVPMSDGNRWTHLAGCGVVGDYASFDVLRGRRVARVQMPYDVLWIRPGAWVVRKTLPGTTATACLWDPEHGTFAPIQGTSSDRILATHPDGRLLVLESAAAAGEPPRAGVLALVDPESGALRELPLPPELAPHLVNGFFHGFTAAGDQLFALADHRSATDWVQWIARFDPRTDQLDCIGPFGDVVTNLLGSPDRDTVLFVEDERRLMRAFFDGRPAEVLFPRPSPSR